MIGFDKIPKDKKFDGVRVIAVGMLVGMTAVPITLWLHQPAGMFLFVCGFFLMVFGLAISIGRVLGK